MEVNVTIGRMTGAQTRTASLPWAAPVVGLAVSVAGRAHLSAGAPPETQPGPARRGPLAGLPSRPGETVEKIKRLGDNQWLKLGAPAADPKWGVARGRSWGGKSMVAAPDLRGAFFCGEGPHALVKPDG